MLRHLEGLTFPEVAGRMGRSLDSVEKLWLRALVLGAQAAQAQPKTTPSGLPVPRYVTLKFGKVNARSGPGDDHRLIWVYQAKGLPVQVVAETAEWRKVCDPEGHTAWVHKRVTDGRRNVINLADVHHRRLAAGMLAQAFSFFAVSAVSGSVLSVFPINVFLWFCLGLLGLTFQSARHHAGVDEPATERERAPEPVLRAVEARSVHRFTRSGAATPAHRM